ncbi:TonB-dependent siderophore receptor [Variovorax sp. J22G21]|uniref:TonB-dependent siderophore receptor n=1 Tax=Variovorax fucosicus TaxID=3053517 RepID=UPI0025773EF3|nr:MULTISPECIES: TonB-dependent siderophore receptor [unclassified Variovorax]MDM0041211.1 TonB-dependent siderophore receptor [Variovorax sp. J22R193]MDM0060268.1 TonB-dependent siderophore receptor [Variovorax sp. J22G21]
MIPIYFAGNRVAGFRLLPLALAMAPLFAGPAIAQTAEAPAAAQLSTIEVVGRTESGAYHSEEAAGAKTALPLRELPQSVRIVTRQAIDDLGATRLDDVLDYVGGVSRQNNFGGLWDNIAIRGLPGNENTGMATLLNGFSSNRGFNAPRDLAGVERIEFLKGTAAALYGSSEPGGTLNIVSKRPLWKAAHSVEGYVGSYGLKRGAFDSTGPIGENFAFRLNVAVEDRDSFRDHVGASRQVIAPAFTWKLGRDTVLEYAGEVLRHKTPLDRGVVAVNNQLGAIPRSRFLGEPTDGDVTVDNQTHQFILSHEWNSTWRSRLGLSWRETSVTGFSTEASALRADNATLTRQRRFRDFDSSDTALQAELQGNVKTGAVEHELLIGLESFRFSMDSLMLRANPTTARPYAITIYNPVYGQAQPTPTANTDTLEHQRGTAFYFQDAIRLAPEWRLVAGVRVDDNRQSLLNRRTNATARQDPSSTSPRVGLSWLPTPQWTFYANAGRSFRPNVGSDFAANSFEPETGRALELGTKWESADKGIGATAALFDIRKRNVLTSDPVNTGYSVSAGEIRSRGLELDFAGQVTKHWRVNASLVFNDVEITKDNSLEVGGRLLNVPKVNGSVLAVYEDAFANGQRYGLGGGVTHVGKRLGQARTQAEANAGTPAFELPGYTTAKLVAYWRLNPALRLTLDVDNLFDKTYYTSSYSRLWVTPGTARTLTVGLQARF